MTENRINKKTTFKFTFLNGEFNLFFQTTYALFIMCALYASSFLPYGRFYNRLGGNIGMLGSYLYLFFYLTFTSLRRPYWLDLYYNFVFNKSKFLKKLK